jgi:hypothetical protein
MPTVVAVINSILMPIRRMKITEVEYVLLASVLFFDPGEKQKNYGLINLQYSNF